MDAFYAAVETLSNPTLKGKPMAVGSMSMLSTANYEVHYDLDIVSVLSGLNVLNHGIPDPHLVFTQARKFGVRAAMPGFIARKLCPELIFVPTDFKKYTYYSDLTRKGILAVCY